MKNVITVIVLAALASACRLPFADTREARWVRADARESAQAYEACEGEHLSTNYDRAYTARGRDMTCDDGFPSFTFECAAFPHN